MLAGSRIRPPRLAEAETKYNVVTEFTHLGLHAAASTGNVGLVKYALTHGQPVNSVLDGVLPLHAAASGGSDIVVKVLIEHGADVNAPRLPHKYTSEKHRNSSLPIVGTPGSTPLHFAAANGHTPVVLTLLLSGANPAQADKLGHTPEHVARGLGRIETADLLRDWLLNRDQDLVERELHKGESSTLATDRGHPISESSTPGDTHTDGLGSGKKMITFKRSLGLLKPSLSNLRGASAEQNEGDSTSPITDRSLRRLHSRQSVRAQDPPSPSSPPVSDGIAFPPRRPSLPVLFGEGSPPSKPINSPRPAKGRRPRSAGTGAEAKAGYPYQNAARETTTVTDAPPRKLSSKLSLLSLFKKTSDAEGSSSLFSSSNTSPQNASAAHSQANLSIQDASQLSLPSPPAGAVVAGASSPSSAIKSMRSHARSTSSNQSSSSVMSMSKPRFRVDSTSSMTRIVADGSLAAPGPPPSSSPVPSPRTTAFAVPPARAVQPPAPSPETDEERERRLNQAFEGIFKSSPSISISPTEEKYVRSKEFPFSLVQLPPSSVPGGGNSTDCAYLAVPERTPPLEGSTNSAGASPGPTTAPKTDARGSAGTGTDGRARGMSVATSKSSGSASTNTDYGMVLAVPQLHSPGGSSGGDHSSPTTTPPLTPAVRSGRSLSFEEKEKESGGDGGKPVSPVVATTARRKISGLNLNTSASSGNLATRRAHTPLGIVVVASRSVSSHAQAEALVQERQQSLLDLDAQLAEGHVNDAALLQANEEGDTPLSARLAAFGESLALERRMKKVEEERMQVAQRSRGGSDRGGRSGSGDQDGMVVEADCEERDVVHSPSVAGYRSRSAQVADRHRREISLDQRPGGRHRTRQPRRPNTASGGVTSPSMLSPADLAHRTIRSSSRPATAPHARNAALEPTSTAGSSSPQAASDQQAPKSAVTTPSTALPSSSTMPIPPVTPLTSPISRTETAPNFNKTPTTATSGNNAAFASVVTNGMPLQRICTEPMDSSSSLYHPPPTSSLSAKRSKDALKQANSASKLARMGFSGATAEKQKAKQQVPYVGSGSSVVPSSATAGTTKSRFGIKSLVQSIRGKN